MAWDTLWPDTDDEYTLAHAQAVTRLPLTDDHMVTAERRLAAELGFSVRGLPDGVHVSVVLLHERQGVADAVAWYAADEWQRDNTDDSSDGGPLVQQVATGDQSVTFAEPVPLAAASGSAPAATTADYAARARRALLNCGVLGRRNSGNTGGGVRAPRWATSPIVNDI